MRDSQTFLQRIAATSFGKENACITLRPECWGARKDRGGCRHWMKLTSVAIARTRYTWRRWKIFRSERWQRTAVGVGAGCLWVILQLFKNFPLTLLSAIFNKTGDSSSGTRTGVRICTYVCAAWTLACLPETSLCRRTNSTPQPVSHSCHTYCVASHQLTSFQHFHTPGVVTYSSTCQSPRVVDLFLLFFVVYFILLAPVFHKFCLSRLSFVAKQC